MIKIYCDKCGKIIPDEELKDTTLKTRPLGTLKDIEMTLCSRCMAKLYTTVNTWLNDKLSSFYELHPDLKEKS